MLISLKLSEFNGLDEAKAIRAMLECCTAENWARLTVSHRPYQDLQALLHSATANWQEMQKADWLQAFDGHPKIGDPTSLKKKYQSTHQIASEEQSGVHSAPDQVIADLALANQTYLERFGFIFIICATGKTAEEMLTSVRERMDNTIDQELCIAATEQHKITLIRLQKLIIP